MDYPSLLAKKKKGNLMTKKGNLMAKKGNLMAKKSNLMAKKEKAQHEYYPKSVLALLFGMLFQARLESTAGYPFLAEIV